jgi:hypothetical protein
MALGIGNWISLDQADIPTLEAELAKRREAAEDSEKARKAVAAEQAERRRIAAADAPKRLRELRKRLADAVADTGDAPTPEQRAWARRLLLGLAGDEAQTATLGIAPTLRGIQMDAGTLLGELYEADAVEAAAEADQIECDAFAAWYRRVAEIAGVR